MAAISSHVRQSGTLIAAVDAVLNYKALCLVLLGLVAGSLVGLLFGSTAIGAGNLGLAGLGLVLAYLVTSCGINAAGILLMDEAAGLSTRSLIDALVAGAIATVKLIGVLIVGVAISLLFTLAWALVFWACKIPVFGPILFTAALPLAVIFFGVLVFALWVLLPQITAPAVWAGEGVFQAIARLMVVAQNRLINVLVYDVVLALVVVVAAIIVWLILAAGFLGAGGLVMTIVGGSAGGVANPSFPFGSLGGMSRQAQGYALAGGIGGGLLITAGIVVPVLILVRGMCQIYLAVTADLDFSKAESGLRQGVAQVKEKTNAVRERVQQQNVVARQAAAAAGPAATSPSSVDSQPIRAETPGRQPSTRLPGACPRCHAVVTAADAFCGNCGTRLG